MSEWDKLWETRGLKDWLKDTRLTQNQWLDEVQAEGDRMQKRIEELEIINIELSIRIEMAIRYGSLIKKNIDTEQKLEAIRPFIMECKDVMVKEAILEVLGDE